MPTFSEEWESVNENRKYPLLASATLRARNPAGAVVIPTDFIVDVLITTPGAFSSFVLDTLVVGIGTATLSIRAPSESIVATIEQDSEEAALIGQTSGVVLGVVVFGSGASTILAYSPGTYSFDLTNKFVPKVFRSRPNTGAGELRAGGESFLGDVRIVVGRGMTKDAGQTSIDLVGDQYKERDIYYQTQIPNTETFIIRPPIKTVNNYNNLGTFFLEFYSSGAGFNRFQIRNVSATELRIIDIKAGE